MKEEQLNEAVNYAKFLLHKNENEQFLAAISIANTRSESFDFLESEPDLYNESDIVSVK